MNLITKLFLIITMTAALFFGFLPLFYPHYNFERLHIFLFNLCSGGTVILIYTEEKKGFSVRTALFFIFSLLYAIFAFLQMYVFAVPIALLLALLAESVRLRKFSFIPWNFFRRIESTSGKFHHASLLCLSLGLVISALVISNHEYLKLVTSPKLTLDVFFLGFSFPVSLITMSVMYGMMKDSNNLSIRIFTDASFWIINLGVLVFFLFILMQKFLAELITAVILSVTVIMVWVLHIRLGFKKQPKAFLTSGMVFLFMTAITGIAYIPSHLFLPEPFWGKLILKLHALVSLYGWNLSGLAVICRYNDFPIKLHSARMIMFHWAIVILVAPLGFFYRPLSIIAVLAYALFLSTILFSRCARNTPEIIS
jgi:hypothetical protein